MRVVQTFADKLLEFLGSAPNWGNSRGNVGGDVPPPNAPVDSTVVREALGIHVHRGGTNSSNIVQIQQPRRGDSGKSALVR